MPRVFLLPLEVVVVYLAALSNALRWPPINKLNGGPRRRRDPSVRDPRRRFPVAYEFLFSAHRTVLYRIAGIYRARNVMLPPPWHPPVGSGDIVGDCTEAPSAFTWSSPLGLGTCHWVHDGEWFNERVSLKLTIRFPGNKLMGPTILAHIPL